MTTRKSASTQIIDTTRLLDYWRSAELWELPELPKNLHENSRKPPIQAEPERDALRIYLGCHRPYYLLSPDRRNHVALKPSFIIALMVPWEHQYGQPARLGAPFEDHWVVNRGLLLRICNDSGSPSEALEQAEHLELRLKETLAAVTRDGEPPRTIELLNAAALEVLADFDLSTLKPLHPRHEREARWNWGRRDWEPEQFGPFFTDELLAIREAVDTGQPLSAPLLAYLGFVPPLHPALVGNAAGEAEKAHRWCSASRIPAGRWPSNPTFGLSYLQHIALQTARENHPLVAVNGPPGTGKTTLLKDLIADRFVERTRQLIGEWRDARSGILGRRVPPQGKGFVYAIDTALRFAMVVASANNSAVENISRELPQLDKEIAGHFPELGYFRELASAHGEGRWGLFTAVLGNATNRRRFIDGSRQGDRVVPGDLKRLRKHLERLANPDCVTAFLKTVAKARQAGGDARDPWKKLKRAWEQLAANGNHERFLEQWDDYLRPQSAPGAEMLRAGDVDGFLGWIAGLDEDSFAAVSKACDAGAERAKKHAKDERRHALSVAIGEFEEAESRWRLLVHRAEELETLSLELRKDADGLKLREKRAQVVKAQEDADVSHAAAEEALLVVKGLCDHRAARVQVFREKLARQPWWRRWLAPLFPSLLPEADRRDLATAESAWDEARLSFADAQAALGQSEAVRKRLHAEMSAAQQALGRHERQRSGYQQRLTEIAGELALVPGHHLFGLEGWDADEARLQQASPWGSKLLNRARAELFAAALRVNERMVENAAQFHFWLDWWAEMVQSPTQDNKRITDLGPEGRHALWSFFFLCFPVISTTCHSAGRLFRSLRGPDSLGYLLVDEAGQAVPYHLVGLLQRARHAVIVGDPLQLEPVVTLPDHVDIQLAREYAFGADDATAHHYLVTAASGQTLADAASPVQGMIGNRAVGVPLRVHRRCDEPMFSISNSIAYQETMVLGKAAPDCLFPEIASGWFDVRGDTEDEGERYWNPAELKAAVDIVRRLFDLSERFPEKSCDDPLLPVYVITPFRLQAEKLRERFKKEGWHRDKEDKLLVDSGTVHTFQGKEAETVLICMVCDHRKKGGTNFVAGKANLLNVAVSRAKRRLILIGNHEIWRHAGHAETLADKLPLLNPEALL